jgi:hypothetical protein
VLDTLKGFCIFQRSNGFKVAISKIYQLMYLDFINHDQLVDKRRRSKRKERGAAKEYIFKGILMIGTPENAEGRWGCKECWRALESAVKYFLKICDF